MTTEKAGSIDDPEAIATTIREAMERTEAALRERPLPIATEPPTVFKP